MYTRQKFVWNDINTVYGSLKPGVHIRLNGSCGCLDPVGQLVNWFSILLSEDLGLSP